jgi:hypothetical protein
MTTISRDFFSLWLDLNVLSLTFYGILNGISFGRLLFKTRGRFGTINLKVFTFVFLLNFCLRAMPKILVSNLFAAKWLTLLKISDQYNDYICSFIVVTFLTLANLIG